MHFSILEDFLRNNKLEKGLEFSRLLKDKEIAQVVVKNKKKDTFMWQELLNVKTKIHFDLIV